MKPHLIFILFILQSVEIYCYCKLEILSVTNGVTPYLITDGVLVDSNAIVKLFDGNLTVNCPTPLKSFAERVKHIPPPRSSYHYSYNYNEKEQEPYYEYSEIAENSVQCDSERQFRIKCEPLSIYLNRIVPNEEECPSSEYFTLTTNDNEGTKIGGFCNDPGFSYAYYCTGNRFENGKLSSCGAQKSLEVRYHNLSIELYNTKISKIDPKNRTVNRDWFTNANYHYNHLVQSKTKSLFESIKALFVPWWSTLLHGSWTLFNKALDERSQNTTYQVLVGTSGAAKYAQVHCAQRDIPYALSSNNVNIPQYIWAYLKSENASEEFVVLARNSPKFGDLPSLKDICENICEEISWLSDVREFFKVPELGEVICCDVESFMEKQDVLQVPKRFNLTSFFDETE